MSVNVFIEKFWGILQMVWFKLLLRILLLLSSILLLLRMEIFLNIFIFCLVLAIHLQYIYNTNQKIWLQLLFRYSDFIGNQHFLGFYSLLIYPIHCFTITNSFCILYDHELILNFDELETFVEKNITSIHSNIVSI